MPNSKAAAKALRQTRRRGAHNAHWLTQLEVAERKFAKAATAGDRASADTAYRTVVKIADKSAARSVIHRNRAARVKSRLAARLSKISAKT